jgi:biopolymer transport protein TolR
MAFGRFDRTPGPQPMSDINMTPLVDVMLVLVVIFILTAPLMASAIRLDLPRADGVAPGGAAPRSIALVIDAQGQAYLDDQPLAQPALAQRLQRLGQQNPDAEVQLRADTAVPYGRVVEVLGAAQAAGLQRIGFVAVPAGAEGSASAAPVAAAVGTAPSAAVNATAAGPAPPGAAATATTVPPVPAAR